MSTGEVRKLLSFPSAASYMGFLLTCLEEPAFSRGSVIYEERLNKIFVRKQAHTLHIAAFGDPQLIKQLEHMAVANGGQSSPYKPLDKRKFHEKVLSVEKLLRSIRLHPAPMDSAKFDHLLIGLYDADANLLGEFLKRVWDLGARGVEVAFVNVASKKGVPSHFIRMFGMRHSDAFHAWWNADQRKLEVYTPLRTDRRDSRFYTLWGYRHPVTELDQVVELDRELVLLRPKANEQPVVTEWVTFKQGTVNFFRKAYEFADLEIELNKIPLLELEEDSRESLVPLEVAIVHKPKTRPNRIWQLDQQIDRQRRELQDLEITRSRLAAGEHEEVYFAYRFDQAGENDLNPRLIRLLQQRVGTLNHYEYAYCKPERGQPYHLVISNRTQRQMGFSLQPADRLYYQPAQWRQWGVNLYVPLNAELAPRVDSNDALPILQKFLEQSGQAGDEDANGIMEAAAVIWETGQDEQIYETRIMQTAPLLSQFRLLNSFQRETAGQVADATRRELLEGFRAARSRVDIELDDLTRELLQHVGQRTEKLQTSFAELDKAVRSAEKLLETIEPRVQQVREVILDLPDQWVLFVNRVIELHRAVVDPEIAAAVKLREQLNVGRADLRALAARNRDLSETVSKHRDSLGDDLADCDKTLAEGACSREEIDELLKRATAVFLDVGKMHGQLSARIGRVHKIEAKADKMQKEIDEIGEREQEVARRIEELVPLHEAFQEKATEVEANKSQMEAREQTLARRAAELARRREEINQRLLQIAGQMERIEAHLHEYAESADQLEQTSEVLDEQVALVDAHADAIRMWDAQEQNWRQYISVQHGFAEEQLQQLQRNIGQLEEEDVETDALREHMQQAREYIAKAEAIVQRGIS